MSLSLACARRMLSAYDARIHGEGPISAGARPIERIPSELIHDKVHVVVCWHEPFVRAIRTSFEELQRYCRDSVQVLHKDVVRARGSTASVVVSIVPQSPTLPLDDHPIANELICPRRDYVDHLLETPGMWSEPESNYVRELSCLSPLADPREVKEMKPVPSLLDLDAPPRPTGTTWDI